MHTNIITKKFDAIFAAARTNVIAKNCLNRGVTCIRSNDELRHLGSKSHSALVLEHGEPNVRVKTLAYGPFSGRMMGSSYLPAGIKPSKQAGIWRKQPIATTGQKVVCKVQSLITA